MNHCKVSFGVGVVGVVKSRLFTPLLCGAFLIRFEIMHNKASFFLSDYLFWQVVLCGLIQVALMASKMTKKDAGG